MKPNSFLILLIVFSLFILFSFSFNCADSYFDIFYEWENFTFDEVKFNNEIEVYKWILNNIKYTRDNKPYDPKTPYETLNDGEGDCEDFCILFLAITNYQFNKKGSLQEVDIRDDNINSVHHVQSRVGSKIYYKSEYSDFFAIRRIINFDDIPYYISAR